MPDTVKNAIARGERVIQRDDGALVLMCESGNPQLGIMLTPGRAGGGIIVSMPEDERGHPLSVVSIGLGDEQVAALAQFAAREAAC